MKKINNMRQLSFLRKFSASLPHQVKLGVKGVANSGGTGRRRLRQATILDFEASSLCNLQTYKHTVQH